MAESREDTDADDIGLVLQGPLITEGNFTLNTVKLYRQLFGDALIIVSTWEGEDERSISELKKLCTVIQSPMPQERGCCNVNCQIYSSRVGIRYAAGKAKKYILKSRTDWRIYSPHTFAYMKALLERFPAGGTTKGKIIAVDNYDNRTSELPPFWVSDFLYFGYTEDIQHMFEIPFNPFPYRNVKEYAKVHGLDVLPDFWEQCRLGLPPEFYICSEYVKRYEPEGKYDSMEFFRQCLDKYFLIISPWDIDAYWPKYKTVFFQPMPWTAVEEGKYTGTCNNSFLDYLAFITKKTRRNKKE